MGPTDPLETTFSRKNGGNTTICGQKVTGFRPKLTHFNIFLSSFLLVTRKKSVQNVQKTQRILTILTSPEFTNGHNLMINPHIKMAKSDIKSRENPHMPESRIHGLGFDQALNIP